CRGHCRLTAAHTPFRLSTGAIASRSRFPGAVVLTPAPLNPRFSPPISFSGAGGARSNRRNGIVMNTTALIRPAWTPATIALMVLGFVVFWPLGLAMLAYIIWGDRLDGFKRDVNRATDGVFAGCRRSADKAH